MLQVGEVVQAAVTRTEVYGVYLTHQGREIIVLIPDISWVPVVRDCRDFTGPGDEFDVKILGINEQAGICRGSIKDVCPEEDPWRDPTTFRPETVREGTVTHEISGGRGEGGLVGYMVRLRPGVSGLLMVGDIGEDLAVGETVEVRVAEVDKSSQKIRLVPSWRDPRDE